MWLETSAMIIHLGISRQTLWRLRRVRILREGHHWTRKTPGCPRSDLLWHTGRCELALKLVVT
jgi:hypothetical protein